MIFNESKSPPGQSSGATSVINDAIDTPFSITNFFDALLENEEYLTKYHEYLNELVENYVNGGEFEKTYERIRSQIDSLVETDPTAFYTYEEYEKAAQMLCQVVQLRADSVQGQLDGTILSTDDGQKEDSSSLIDGSDIDLSVMGTFSGGGGNKDGMGGENDGDFTPPGFPGDAEINEAESKEDSNDTNFCKFFLGIAFFFTVFFYVICENFYNIHVILPLWLK